MQTARLMPRPTGKCVGGVRREMLERGFTLVNAPWRCDDDLFSRLKSGRVVFHDNRWAKFTSLARYGCWLEWLLGMALPEESLSLVALEFRHEQAGAVDPQVDRLHADGSYIRSVCTLYGLTTVYRDRDAELSVPATPIMTLQKAI